MAAVEGPVSSWPAPAPARRGSSPTASPTSSATRGRLRAHRRRHLHQQGGERDARPRRGARRGRARHALDRHLPRLLRPHAAPRRRRAGLAPDFTIYDQDDQLAMVREADAGRSTTRRAHPPAACSPASPREERGRAGRGRRGYASDLTRRVIERYEEGLRVATRWTSTTCSFRRSRFWTGTSPSAGATGSASRYFLVDEYQDTNRAAVRPDRAARRRHRNLCVVGDDDQSIYSWRGADIREHPRLRAGLPRRPVVRLEQNYRSTPTILEAARALVIAQLRRKGKTLRAENGRPATRCDVHEALDERQEATWVTRAHRGAALGGHGSRCCYRMNAQTPARSRRASSACACRTTSWGGVSSTSARR